MADEKEEESSRRDSVTVAEQSTEPLKTKGLFTEALLVPASECGCDGWSSGSHIGITRW